MLQAFVVTRSLEPEAILARVRELMGRSDARGGAPRVGVGEAYALGPEPERVIAVVVGRTALALDPVPRRVAPGQRVRVSGRLPPGWREPRVVTMGPDLAIVEPDVAARGARFSATVVAPRAEGRLDVEVLGTGPHGPSPLTQLALYVGQDPPDRFEGAWPPEEREIADAWDAEAEALDRLNRDRARFGLPELRHDSALADIARAHSEDMRDGGFFGHHSPRTGSLTDRIGRAGYPAIAWAENLAGNRSLVDAQATLMHSLGHRRNVLSPSMTHVGVGVAEQRRDGHRVWLLTQVFARIPAPLDPAAARAQLLERLDAARAAAGHARFVADARLERVATQAAALTDAAPRDALDLADERGLTRRGAAAWVITVSDLEAFDAPAPIVDTPHARIGIGLYRDPGDPTRTRVVVVVGS